MPKAPMMIFLKSLCIILLFSIVGLRAQGEASSASTAAERMELGLGQDGSLVDALVFEHAWLRAFPNEHCRAIPLSAQAPGEGRISKGAALYSKDGRCFVRCSAHGTFPLPEIQAAEWDKPESLRQLAEKALAGKPLLADPTEETLQQILIATARIKSSQATREFGATMTKMPVQIRREGQIKREEREYLIFDHKGVHYAYRPGTGGVVSTPLPVDPKYGYAQPCVKGGDFIDALQYLNALRAQTPQLKARITGKASMPGLTCVVIHEGDRLRVHHVYLGDFVLKGVPVNAFDNEEAIVRHLQKLCMAALRKPQRGGGMVTLSSSELVSLFASLAPMEMPGDDDGLQVLRVADALCSAGIEGVKVKERASVSFSYEGTRYLYSPATGTRPVQVRATSSVGKLSVSPQEKSAPQGKRRSGVIERYVPSAGVLASLKAKADEGDRQACKEFGTYLMEGNGLPKDVVQGERYLTKAAETGEGESALMLARHFDKPGQSPELLEKSRHFYGISAKAAFPWRPVPADPRRQDSQFPSART